MIDGAGAYQSLHDARRMARAECDRIGPTGREKGEAEAAYQAALAKRMLELRSEGVPASMAKDIARGDRAVAAAYVRFVAAEAIHRATIESELLYKKDVDVYREEVNRGWANS